MRHPRAARRPAVVALVVALLLGGAACGDDGDDSSTPTTTAPEGSDGADDAGTTPSSTGGGTEGTGPDEADAPTTVPGDDADVLTVEQADAQLDALLAIYQDALAGVRASGALDEVALQAFTGAFTASAAQGELSGLVQVGAPASLDPDAPPLAATAVQLTGATPACASGSTVVDGFPELITPPLEVRPPHHFRLVPAADGEPGPAWRIDFLRTGDGAAEEARCA